MSAYNLNTTVSKQEAEALKELIFKRARERAQALTDDVQTNCTTFVQNEIMDLARDSFMPSRNPFAEKVVGKSPEMQSEEKDLEIGFAKRQVKEVESQVKYAIKTPDVAKAEVDLTMEAARVGLSQKSTFMGALNFLNSQASISLVNRSQKNFDAIA